MILHPMTFWSGCFVFMRSIFVILSEVVPHTSVNLDIKDPWPPKLISNVLQHHLFILQSLFLENGGGSEGVASCALVSAGLILQLFTHTLL